MSNRGKKEFYDRLKDIFSKALMDTGEMGAMLMSQNELSLDEVAEVLEHVAKETEKIADLRGADRDKFMRDWVEGYIRKDPSIMERFLKSRRPSRQGFTPNQPFQRPSANHDPYNHSDY